MSKERTVLLRTTSFSVEAGEAAVGARPATVASDEYLQPAPRALGMESSSGLQAYTRLHQASAAA